MATNQHVVAVIVETDAGARIHDVAARRPVWVVDTPANRAAAEALRAEGRDGTANVTLFRADPASLPDEWVVQILAAVVEHHGEAGRDVSLTALELYGVLVMDDRRAALSAHGFDLVTSDGDVVRAEVGPVGSA